MQHPLQQHGFLLPEERISEPKNQKKLITKFEKCVGCDIVQADHAPEAGVAQRIFHGVLVRHHGRNQEEVEEGLGQEVKGLEEDDTQEQVRMSMTMDGNEDTQTRLEPHVTKKHMCI